MILKRPMVPRYNLRQTLAKLLKEVKFSFMIVSKILHMSNNRAKEHFCIGTKNLTHNFTAVHYIRQLHLLIRTVNFPLHFFKESGCQ